MSVKTKAQEVAERQAELNARLAEKLIMKGVEADATETTTTLIDKVGAIEQNGGNVNNDGWVRPSNWLPYPTFSEEYDEVWLLVRVTEYSGNVHFYINYKLIPFNIDYGDGVVETNQIYVNNYRLHHFYDYNDIDDNQIIEDGVKLCWCRVWLERGKLGKFGVGNNYTNQYPIKNTVLEIVVNTTSADAEFVQYSDGGFSCLCENIKIVNKELPLKILKLKSMVSLQNIDGEYLFTDLNGSNNPILNDTPNFNVDVDISNQVISATSRVIHFSMCGAKSIKARFEGKVSLVNMFTSTRAKTITLLGTEFAEDWAYSFNNASHLRNIYIEDMSSATVINGLFYGCVRLIDAKCLESINPLRITNCDSTFSGCTSLKEITDMAYTNCTMWYRTFMQCRSLNKIGLLDLTRATSTTEMFNCCYDLREVRFVEGSIPLSLQLNHSELLSAESIQSIIDGLKDLTGQTAQTITLNTNVKAKLTPEQIATITNKNWTLA